MPFDTVRDLRSVGTVGTSQHVLTVSPSLPVNNVKELLDYIRARPANELSFGSAGTGSTFHLSLIHIYRASSMRQMGDIGHGGAGARAKDPTRGTSIRTAFSLKIDPSPS